MDTQLSDQSSTVVTRMSRANDRGNQMATRNSRDEVEELRADKIGLEGLVQQSQTRIREIQRERAELDRQEADETRTLNDRRTRLVTKIESIAMLERSMVYDR